jgi:hypothetical protein
MMASKDLTRSAKVLSYFANVAMGGISISLDDVMFISSLMQIICGHHVEYTASRMAARRIATKEKRCMFDEGI